MGKNVVIGILVVLVFIFAWLAFVPGTKKVSSNKVVSKLSDAGKITCTYPQTLYASYLNGKIEHELSKPETNPIIMTFSDITTDEPKIQFIDATRTISEVPLIKVVDTEDRLLFIEGNGEPYMTMHTIFKNSGVSTYEKTTSLIGTPVGTIGMGACVDY